MDNKSKEYKDLLESASIYVLASERENSSVSLLEAMSAGCTVITTNVSGCPETVGDAGITVNPNDAKEIKEPLKKIINKNKIQSLGKKARQRVIKESDWNINITNRSINKCCE